MGGNRRRGRSIVILGPDGAGKTLLADALTERLGTSGTVLRAHGNPRLLPRRTPVGKPVLEPHAGRPYGRISGFAKLMYVFVDVAVAWAFVVPRRLRQGSWMVIERGWWDIVIDPRRYRLGPGRLPARLGRLLPQADLTVVLGGPPEVLFRRKPELSIDEIARQIDVARTLLPPSARVIHLDASRPIAELVVEVMDRLADRPSRGTNTPPPPDEWVRLPRGRSQRAVLIPRSPRRLATAGLRVYHPATKRGYIAWLVARRAVALGAARLLPRGPAPPELSLLDGVVPRNTTFAIASSRHPNRSTALCIGSDGELIAIAKLATDDTGRHRLVREARMARELGPHVSAPLSSPAILAEGPGYLVFEPLTWKARWSPSELPDDVAAALGRMYRAAGRADNDRGFAHGDFAPWNLLRTNDGWALIDWADAELDARPFQDVFHYLIQSSVLLGTPRPSDILAGVHGTGPVARPLAAYAEGAGIPASRAKEFLAEYLETSPSRLLPGRDQADGLSVRRRLLEQLRGGATQPPQTAATPGAGLEREARPRIRRAGWGILDQALSSLTNFALAVALARQLSLPDFGAAGIAFAVYLIVLNASRALSTEPLTVRYSGVTHAAWRSGSASAVGSALAVGVLTGALSGVAGVVLGGVVGAALVALGLTLPGLLVQDAWRYAFFAAGRARSAFLNDLAWAVLLIPALIAAAGMGGGGPAPYLLAWGLAATGAALFGAYQARLVPAPMQLPGWLREQRDLAPRYFVEFVVLSGAAQLRLLLVGAIADLAVVGALRGGQVLLGALHPLTYGLQLTLVPDAVRAARHSTAPLRQLTIRLAAALAAVSLIFGVGLMLLPDTVGLALLGATWTDARPTLPGQTLIVAASGAALGALVGLRALAAASRSMRARIVASGLGLIGAVAGAATGDAAVCALLIGAGVSAGALVWWREYLEALRLVPSAGPEAGQPPRPEQA